MEFDKEKLAQNLRLLQRMQMEADVYLHKRSLERQGSKSSFDTDAVSLARQLGRGYGTYLVKGRHK